MNIKHNKFKLKNKYDIYHAHDPELIPILFFFV